MTLEYQADSNFAVDFNNSLKNGVGVNFLKNGVGVNFQ